MKQIKITGMCICAFVCLVLCGCNATFETPANDESSSSVSESVSDGLQSSLIQASSSGDVEPSSSAPQESFCGNITKAEVSSENRLMNCSRPFTVDNDIFRLCDPFTRHRK